MEAPDVGHPAHEPVKGDIAGGGLEGDKVVALEVEFGEPGDPAESEGTRGHAVQAHTRGEHGIGEEGVGHEVGREGKKRRTEELVSKKLRTR